MRSRRPVTMVEAYCVKCKTKRDMANPQPTKTAKGTDAVRGKCPVCGTGMMKFGKA